MKKFKLETKTIEILADNFTPVGLFLKLRDRFPNILLLESSDYHSSEDSFSYLCCLPIAGIEGKDYQVKINWPDGTTEKFSEPNGSEVIRNLALFSESFRTDLDIKHTRGFVNNGLFGFWNHETVKYTDSITVPNKGTSDYEELPEFKYQVFRFVLVFDHFHNSLHLFEHSITEGFEDEQTPGLENLLDIIRLQSSPQFDFETVGQEESDNTDEEFLDKIKVGQKHCFRGDVFQIVLSRRFEQAFKGDEFNVYRYLRSINPSPYLFYFDYGTYKIFGSSPEAQIKIENRKATIFPIAGTFKRTGHDAEDLEKARELFNDKKENSEHVMLVDLARNDLSRHCNHVKVEVFKEIQFFSHVIHLVSKVSGEIPADFSYWNLVADTFPAGTLSGAPKYRALEIIRDNENTNRGFYGGCIGYAGFDGSFNHAITIRSFLSHKNKLFYRAGAGIVTLSRPESELQEVNNKIAALRKAIQLANSNKQ